MDTEQIIAEFKFKNPKSRVLNNNKYTKKFQKYNISLLKQGRTKKIVYDDKKIYNELTKRIVNKDKYYKKNGGVRSKYNNEDFVVNDSSFFQPTQYIKKVIRPQIAKAEQVPTETQINID